MGQQVVNEDPSGAPGDASAPAASPGASPGHRFHRGASPSPPPQQQ